MKILFTIQAPSPLSFVAEVNGDVDAWRLLGYLSCCPFPITHIVQDKEPTMRVVDVDGGTSVDMDPGQMHEFMKGVLGE